MGVSRGGSGWGAGCGFCSRDQAMSWRVAKASGGNWEVSCGSCLKARGVIARSSPAKQFVVRFITTPLRKTKPPIIQYAIPLPEQSLMAHHLHDPVANSTRSFYAVYSTFTCAIPLSPSSVLCRGSRLWSRGSPRMRAGGASFAPCTAPNSMANRHRPEYLA